MGEQLPAGPFGEAFSPEPKRCAICRTKIIVPNGSGLVVRNAILRVSLETGHASAKCPRCKTWVEVPLKYSH